MPFKRTIEVGRVVLCTYGSDAGKLFVIVDILDGNRVVVDRPDIVRCIYLLKRLAVTDIKIDVARLAKKTDLVKAFEGVEAQFAKTAWGQKLQKRNAKAQMNDFDRYKAMVAKTHRSRLVRKAYRQLKKAM